MALTAAQKNTVRQTAVQYCGSVKRDDEIIDADE